MALTTQTQNQVASNSILDAFNRQTYLGNQFVYASAQTSAGTTETPVLYLLNPVITSSATGSASTKALFVNHLAVTSATASNSAVVRVYLNPAVSANGTAKTPANVRPGSANTSISSLFSVPTVTSNGTLIATLAAAPLSTSRAPADAVLTILDQGQSLLVTVQTSATSTATVIELGQYEL